VKSVAKARASAARKTVVRDSARERLSEAKRQIAVMVARMAVEEKDFAARAKAVLDADAELAVLETELDVRDGRDGTDVRGDETTTQEEHEKLLRLASSSNPEVKWLFKLAQRNGSLPLTQTQADSNEDVASMAVDNRDKDDLLARLEEADLLKGDERKHERGLAIDTYTNCHPTMKASARVSPYGAEA
jgi:hypothetical protein